MIDHRHYIYAITIEDVPIYVGYSERSPAERLKEHLDAARGKHRTKEMELRIALRGQDTLKNRLINKAIEAGLDIDVIILKEADGWEPLDENFWIEKLREEYDLVNAIPGSTWQPYALVNGEIVPTVKVNATEIRGDIQEWKKKPRAKRAAPSFKVPPPKPMTRAEFETARDTAWSVQGVVTKWKGDYKAFCANFEKGWDKIELIPQ